MGSRLLLQQLYSGFGRFALSNLRKNGPVSASVIPIRSYWNKDFKPGPYPETEAERIAAAKKYNLIPEDYKPFPPDAGMGDYPDLPLVPTELKDPNTDWDFRVLKKNYGETLHADINYHGEDRLNPISPIYVSYPEMLFTLIGFILVFVAIGTFFQNVTVSPPALPKQMPGDGRKHYTFELKE